MPNYSNSWCNNIASFLYLMISATNPIFCCINFQAMLWTQILLIEQDLSPLNICKHLNSDISILVIEKPRVVIWLADTPGAVGGVWVVGRVPVGVILRQGWWSEFKFCLSLLHLLPDSQMWPCLSQQHEHHPEMEGCSLSKLTSPARSCNKTLLSQISPSQVVQL